jgi:hypothetical protein
LIPFPDYYDQIAQSIIKTDQIITHSENAMKYPFSMYFRELSIVKLLAQCFKAFKAELMVSTSSVLKSKSEALENANLLKLRYVGHALGMFLAEDQWDEMYKKILRRVQEAGRAKWEIDPAAKRLKRDDFLSWVQNLVSKAQHPGIGGKGEQLREKMEGAGISPDSIEIAQEQRRSYRSRALSPGYMDLSRRQEIEMDTQAHLHQLISKLDAGQLSDTGVEFHSRCLDCLSEVRQHDKEEIPLSFLQGYMYHLADRCLHRFTRVAV